MRYLSVDICFATFFVVIASRFEEIGNYCNGRSDGHILCGGIVWVLWLVYYVCQSSVFLGIWVIAHECGHGSFSAIPAINDLVGAIAHSFLLVPYFSWKISHAKHHAKTGNLEKDEVFVPKVGDTPSEPSIPLSVLKLIAASTIGWLAYIFTHRTGQPYPHNKDRLLPIPTTNHFDPKSPIFSPHDFWWIVLSDVLFIIMIGLLCYWALIFGLIWTIQIYGIPYFITNFWVVSITRMHHTDLRLPRYHNSDWNWLQGALCTVDRDFGFIFNTVTHHICDTHVCHHLFSKIPHYHAQEATQAIIPLLGRYYLKNNTFVFKAIWQCVYECNKVYPDITVDRKSGSKDPALWFNY